MLLALIDGLIRYVIAISTFVFWQLLHFGGLALALYILATRAFHRDQLQTKPQFPTMASGSGNGLNDALRSVHPLQETLKANPSRVEFLSQAIPDDLRTAWDLLVSPASEDNVATLAATSHPAAATVDIPALTTQLTRIRLGNHIADLSRENILLTRGILADPEAKTIDDVARRYSRERLENLLHLDGQDGKGIGPPRVARTAPELHESTVPFHQALYDTATTAYIWGMAERGELFASIAASTRQLSLAASETPPTLDSDHQDVGLGLGKVLANNPEFSFRSSPLSTIADNANAFDGISEQTRPKVEEALRDLQKAQALAHIPEALPVLFQTKMSAFRVSQQPQDQFVAKFGPQVGGAAAAERIHDHAVRVVARNDHALTVALQAARGSGLAAIDGPGGFNRTSQLPEQINLEKLFGSLDYCECSDCSSVTSPAAYYVELLQFLRNNNLNPSSPWKPWTDSPSYDWSPLDYLFRRRPDLACLELTCANSNTVLPYIDLANEVMESFIVHQKRFADSVLVPKQSWIDIFNASDAAEGRGGSSAELLAVPQNVNKTAYEILDRAVYPAARLPYNQPLDTIRQFLVFLATSRAEVMRSFQAVYRPPRKTSVDDWAEVTFPNQCSQPPPPCPSSHKEHGCNGSDDDRSDGSRSEYGSDDQGDDGHDYEKEDLSDDSESETNVKCLPQQQQIGRPLNDSEQARLSELHQEAVSRAIVAEELGISHEEYIILTKEAFWPKAHFDIRYGQELTPAVYRERIGVKNPWEYWGLDYTSVDDMLDLDEDRQSGLAFVKKQLLPRTGVQYSDLVDAIKTRFMNPNMPQGRAKVVMERILFSYEYLLSLMVPGERHPRRRLRKIIRLLENPTSDEQTLSDLLKARLKPLTCCAILYKHNRERERDHNTLVATRPDAQQHDGLQLEAKKQKGHSQCHCGCDSELKKWVLCYFDQVGSIVVLDNGEGLKILFEGDIFNHVPEPHGPNLVDTTLRTLGAQPPGDYLLGHIHKDGRITESATSNILVGHVALSGLVYLTDGSLFMSRHDGEQIIIKRTDPATDKFSDGLIDKDSKLILYEDGPDNVPMDSPWTTGYDDCDLTKGE